MKKYLFLLPLLLLLFSSCSSTESVDYEGSIIGVWLEWEEYDDENDVYINTSESKYKLEFDYMFYYFWKEDELYDELVYKVENNNIEFYLDFDEKKESMAAKVLSVTNETLELEWHYFPGETYEEVIKTRYRRVK